MFEGVNWADLVACVNQRWSPEIGDPSFWGWFTVGLYGAVGGLSLGVVTRLRNRTERSFWLFLAAVLLFLAVNKQLDLQSALTATGRCISKLQGWYAERRGFQIAFIASLIGIAFLCLILGIYVMRRHLRRNGLALLGLSIVVTFVAVRAVGFHHFDTLIKTEFGGQRYNVWFESSGIVLIGLNAIHRLWRDPRA